MQVSVIIPTYNSEKTIEKCLNSFYIQTYPPSEIIVVDGNSADSTTEIVKRFWDVKLVVNKKFHSPGFLRNLGAKVAKGNILLFCDSDCIADKKLIEYYVESFLSRKDIIGVKGTIRPVFKNMVSNFVQKQLLAMEWLNNLNKDGTIKTFFNTANFAIYRSIFLQTMFREDMVSCEDTEFFIRLSQDKKLKILYEPRAFVYHYHPTTIHQLFKQQKWHGEGIVQLVNITGKKLLEYFTVFPPIRYVTISKNLLLKAVFEDNRLLCKGCRMEKIQKCTIKVKKLSKIKIKSEINLHRLTCLAVAAGILKQRTGVDYNFSL
ncbi:MAG: hypothetical protein B6U77_03590 [Candidatus Hecatellales archaeon ex4484_218]|nr:MAG: hypothetical protein B6U77_03590 [Candidatus Hecatellales archaeon ex4484_218]